MFLADIPFSDAGREQIAQLAEACLLAGRGDLVPKLIRQGATLEDTRQLLAEAQAEAAARGPAYRAASPMQSGAASAADLAAAGAARFAVQSRRYDE